MILTATVLAPSLVNRLVEPGQDTEAALAMADRMTATAPLAVWESRKVVLAAATEGDDTLTKMTDATMGVVMRSEDIGNVLTAFIEKPSPQWKGR